MQIAADDGFAHGDCRDTALGTLLRLAGIAHPEDLLLGEWTFEITEDRSVADGLSVAYRSGGPLPTAAGPAGTGIELVHRRAGGLSELLRWLAARARPGRAVAVTVDQYGYEPAPFHRTAHVPHDLVVTAATGTSVDVLDSFPASRFAGRVELARFARWADSPQLGAARWRTMELAVRPDALTRSAGWLAANWQDRIRRNVAAMSDPTGRRGVAAIELVADRLAEWLAGPDFVADPGRRRELPVSSFTDLGAVRRGHALWLSRVAGLGHPMLAGYADQVRAVSRQWDVAASLWLAGGAPGPANPAKDPAAAPATDTAMDRATDRAADPATVDLIARGLRQVPQLLRLIARAEQRIVERLDTAVRAE